MEIICKKCEQVFDWDSKTAQSIQYRQVRQIFTVGAAARALCPHCQHHNDVSISKINSTEKKPRQLQPIGGYGSRTEETVVTAVSAVTGARVALPKPEDSRESWVTGDLSEFIPEAIELEPVSEPSLVTGQHFSLVSRNEKSQSFDGNTNTEVTSKISKVVLGMILTLTCVVTGYRALVASHQVDEAIAVITPAEALGINEAALAEPDADEPTQVILSPDLQRAVERSKYRQKRTTWSDYISEHMEGVDHLHDLLARDAYVSSNFGYRIDPFNKRWRFHHGVDIAVHKGAPIRSFMPGKVIHAGRRSKYGKAVFVEHVDGLITIYAHLSKITVSKGEHITKQDVIGLAGSTGRSTGSHLHFEVRLGNKRIDPTLVPEFKFLAKR